MRSYNTLSVFERNATVLETVLVTAATWGLDKFDTFGVGHAFFSRPVAVALNTFRWYRCGAENLSDVIHEEYDKVQL